MTSSMMEASFLRPPEIVDDFELEQDEILAFDPVFPYCSDVYCTDSDPISLDDHHIHQDHDFVLETYDRTGESIDGTYEEILDRENQVTFVMDLFQQRVEQSHPLEIATVEFDPILESGIGVVQRNMQLEEIGRNRLELEIGQVLGLGTEFDRNKDHGYGDDLDDNFGGFMVSDCGGEFYVSRSESRNHSGGSSNGADEVNRFSGGLNVVSVGSDSEADVDDLLETDFQLEDDYASSSRNDDGNIALCWDSLQLDDGNDLNMDGSDEFEWEEVGNGLDVLNLDVLNPEESVSVLPITGPEEDEIFIEEGRQRGARTLEWEVLLNLNTLERSPNLENIRDPFFGDPDDYIYTAEDENENEIEMTFGQFNASMSRPPASRLVVENLASVIMTEEDVQNGEVICAVCRDDMGIGVQAKQLPCSHRYHSDCIIPWLRIRNSCPVCRHELPTDDPGYEQRRIQGAARGQ